MELYWLTLILFPEGTPCPIDCCFFAKENFPIFTKDSGIIFLLSCIGDMLVLHVELVWIVYYGCWTFYWPLTIPVAKELLWLKLCPILCPYPREGRTCLRKFEVVTPAIPEGPPVEDFRSIWECEGWWIDPLPPSIGLYFLEFCLLRGKFCIKLSGDWMGTVIMFYFEVP